MGKPLRLLILTILVLGGWYAYNHYELQGFRTLKLVPRGAFGRCGRSAASSRHQGIDSHRVVQYAGLWAGQSRAAGHVGVDRPHDSPVRRRRVAGDPVRTSGRAAATPRPGQCHGQPLWLDRRTTRGTRRNPKSSLCSCLTRPRSKRTTRRPTRSKTRTTCSTILPLSVASAHAAPPPNRPSPLPWSICIWIPRRLPKRSRCWTTCSSRSAMTGGEKTT